MNWNQSHLKILDLSEFETKILQSLHSMKSINETVGETEIIRTSISYNLKKLIRRGLVQKIRAGKRYRYIALSPTQLTYQLKNCIDEIQFNNSSLKGVRIKTNKKDEFVIHIGPQEIVPAFKRIAHENKNERIKAIQHHISFNDIVETATPEQIVDFNKAIIKNHIIIEGILNKSAYKSYIDEIISDAKKNKKVIESLSGRMADYYVFPDKRFMSHAEIWIFNATTLIINWKESVAIEITNENMTSFLREMFEYVKDSCEKIDHNEAMRQIIKKVKNFS